MDASGPGTDYGARACPVASGPLGLRAVVGDVVIGPTPLAGFRAQMDIALARRRAAP